MRAYSAARFSDRSFFSKIEGTLFSKIDEYRRAMQNPLIMKLLADSSDVTEKSKIVETVETIVGLLMEDGLVTQMHIPPKNVGVHPSNRYGFGVSAAKVHDLGAKIVGMGWSWAACALAISMADGNGKSAKFTCKMQQGSKKFGRSQLAEINFGSMACGHTNQFLVACIDKAETSEPALAGPDGRISHDMLGAGVLEAMRKGLKWTVLDSAVEDLYGMPLCNLIQRARQAVGQVQNEESVIQLALEVQELAAETEKGGKTANFEEIRSIVLESQPTNPGAVAHICNWVQLYGGGVSGLFVRDLAEFVSLCVPSDREIDPEILESFVQLKKKLRKEELCPDFVCAALKMNYDCPKKWVKSGVCRFLKDNHVSSLGGAKKGDMVNANVQLRSFKNLCKALQLDRDAYQQETGKADCIVARIIFDLAVPAEFDNLTFMQALRKLASLLLAKYDAELENPFGDDEDIDESKGGKPNAAASSSMHGLVEYDDRGVAKGVEQQTLFAQGYVKGTNVETDTGPA